MAVGVRESAHWIIRGRVHHPGQIVLGRGALVTQPESLQAQIAREIQRSEIGAFLVPSDPAFELIDYQSVESRGEFARPRDQRRAVLNLRRDEVEMRSSAGIPDTQACGADEGIRSGDFASGGAA